MQHQQQAPKKKRGKERKWGKGCRRYVSTEHKHRQLVHITNTVTRSLLEPINISCLLIMVQAWCTGSKWQIWQCYDKIWQAWCSQGLPIVLFMKFTGNYIKFFLTLQRTTNNTFWWQLDSISMTCSGKKYIIARHCRWVFSTPPPPLGIYRQQHKTVDTLHTPDWCWHSLCLDKLHFCSKYGWLSLPPRC